jgi:hypothetical protein
LGIFLIVNDLPLHSNQNVDLYADDSTLHSSGDSMNQLNCTLSSAMKDIEQWSTFNGMVINGEKTKSMVICTYQKSTKICSSELHINYNNTVLENVESKRLLGVIVDNHLCWKVHINDLASNLSKLIALFRRIKMYLPLQTRILFYKTFFQPMIDYCYTVWGNHHVKRTTSLY